MVPREGRPVTHRTPWSWLALTLALIGSARSQDAPSEEAGEFFKRNCASCHTIGGGRLAGPDLKGALSRRDAAWLATFIVDPKAVIDSGDPYARKILGDARGVVMPAAPGLTRPVADKLVALIAYESKLEKSKFAGTTVSDRPLTAADVVRGRALFFGEEPLKNGGPACNSCHTSISAGGFGGGRLGPDLSAAFARLEGRKALAAWLMAPPGPTMSPLYNEHAPDGEEALALTAFLKDEAAHGVDAARTSALDFLLAGGAGAAVLLALMDALWRRRFRAVRRPLTTGE